jgi:hypothetical protein
MNKNPSRSWLQNNGPEGHMLAHITPKEGKILQYFGGSGTKDKKTGLKSYFLSGLFGGSKPPPPSTTKAELDPEVKEMRNKVFDKAGDVMDREYEGYEGDRTANMGVDTKAAHGGVRDLQGSGQDAYKAAAGVGKDATGYASDQVGNQSFLSGKGVGDYMNPHTSNVIQGMQGQAMKAMQMGRNQIGASSQMAGAGMGSRSALEKGAMAGEVMSNLNRQTGEMLNKSYSDAAGMKKYDMDSARDADKYNVAAGHKDMDVRDRGAGRMVSGTDAGRAAGYTDAGMLSNVGADIEGRDQNDKDIAYGDFIEERDWDKNNAMFGSNVLGGAPSGTNTTAAGGMGKGSKLGGAIGAGLSGWASTGNPYVGLAMGGASLLS